MLSGLRITCRKCCPWSAHRLGGKVLSDQTMRRCAVLVLTLMGIGI